MSILSLAFVGYGQNAISVDGKVNPKEKSITISQTIAYQNRSTDTLNKVYLNDWNNSYSTKSTALAKRFEEEFSTKFHLAKSEQRGFTVISSIKDKTFNDLGYQRLKGQLDVIEVRLDHPLLPGESYHLNLNYKIVLPDATFTDYGFTEAQNFELKYWYILPAVYDGVWQYYSNKNLNDLYVPKANLTIKLSFPKNYTLTSELNTVKTAEDELNKTLTLKGKDRIDTYLSLHKENTYNSVTTDDFILVSDIFENHDFILMPTTPEVAWPIGDKSEDPVSIYLTDILLPYKDFYEIYWLLIN